jgi:APA family basic amino acid/polyamine antiporter
MRELKRTLNLKATIAIVIGGVIGSGIFMKPALMASQLGSPILLLSVWIVAGLITLFGALSNAEVASMFPETGGQYVFFQKMYGDKFAFFYGWASVSVFNTAGNASIAYIFSQYMNYFIDLPRFSSVIEKSYFFHINFIGTIYPLENFGVKILTAFLIVLLTTLNYWSIKYGSILQQYLTGLKSVAIVLLIVGIFFSGNGSVANVVTSSAVMPEGWSLVWAYMAALSGAFWAYDGWNNITFVAGEIEHPQKNIPKSLFYGLAFCILTYVLINLAYIYVLPIGHLKSSSLAASDAATVAWGSIGGSIIALMIVLSTLGSANANVLSTARVTYVMGQENKLFAWAGKIHLKNETPGNALILNAIWTLILIFSGSFDMLTDMLIFVSWFFYGMSALGIFILRFKMKNVPRPYKVWGYPYIPFLFVLFVVFYLSSTLYSDINNYLLGTTPIINSFLGIVIVCFGWPIHYFSNKKNNRI